MMSDVDEPYWESFDSDVRHIRGALFNGILAVLSPADPVCVTEAVPVREAVAAMIAHHQAGVLIVDPAGRLIGIFTERDVLLRVVGRGLDPNTTTVGQVMTRNPQALRLMDRVAYALHSMAVAGYRTVPITDEQGCPIGVITATDVMRWLGDLFPEAVMNLRPGDRVKNPEQIDAG